MSLERMFDAIEGLRRAASVDAAFGQPQEADGRTLIPVSSVHVGLGMGFGQPSPKESAEEEETAEGGGGGGSAGARPVALIEVTGTDTIVHPIVDETQVALAGIVLGGWVVFLLMVTLRAIFGPRNRAQ